MGVPFFSLHPTAHQKLLCKDPSTSERTTKHQKEGNTLKLSFYLGGGDLGLDEATELIRIERVQNKADLEDFIGYCGGTLTSLDMFGFGAFSRGNRAVLLLKLPKENNKELTVHFGNRKEALERALKERGGNLKKVDIKKNANVN